MFNVPYAAVSKAMRQQSKVLTLVYLMVWVIQLGARIFGDNNES